MKITKSIFSLIIAAVGSCCLAQSTLLQPCENVEFKHGCYGESISKEGTKYVGEFSNNIPDGRGVSSFSSGAKYIGEFKDGLRHGDGTYYYVNGNVYRGSWSNGKRNGEGTLTFSDGKISKGIWENGVLAANNITSQRLNEINQTEAAQSIEKSVCSTTAQLVLSSSGYSGNIEIQLRKGNRPGSKVVATDSVITSGQRDFNGICPGKYIFSFATSDSSSVSITRYFSIQSNTSIAKMTVFMSRTKSGEGQQIQTISKKEL